MAKYSMVINLNACTGCMACVAACSLENQTPYWNRKYRTHVEDISLGTFPDVKRILFPRLCMHCENSPCVTVCPTGASYRTEDGIVLVNPEKCMGCGYCIIACPFGARYRYEKDDVKEAKKIYGKNNEHKVPHVDKCTFCVHRVREGRQPACVETCPTGARIFGDLEDPKSEVYKLVKSGSAKPIGPLGTGAKVYYIK